MLLIAAPVLQAPDDPGGRGLWGIVALVLLLGLVAAHVRVLRAVARQLEDLQAEPQADDVAPPGRPQPHGAQLADSPR